MSVVKNADGSVTIGCIEDVIKRKAESPLKKGGRKPKTEPEIDDIVIDDDEIIIVEEPIEDEPTPKRGRKK